MLEHSFSRLFVPWNIRSNDGTFVLGTIRSLELSFPRMKKPCRPFPLQTIHSFVSRAVPGLLTKKEQHNKQKHRPMTATVHSHYTQTVDRRYSASRLKIIGKEFQKNCYKTIFREINTEEIFFQLALITNKDFFSRKKLKLRKFTVAVYVIYIYGRDITHWCQLWMFVNIVSKYCLFIS